MRDEGGSQRRAGRERWNHNIHYGLQLLQCLPTGAHDALDVGCGEGWMVRELGSRVDHVVGIDVDGASIAEARSRPTREGVEYVAGRFLTHPFQPASFDFIMCIATLHHMDEVAAMRRMAELLRPGGTLAVVGLARSRLPADLGWEAAGATMTRVHKLTKRYWETPAPKVWPPPHSYSEVRDLSQSVLPGSVFRRRALWRYTLTWSKPRA